MAITRHGSAATPEDLASEVSEPVTSAIIPPASMVSGDLVVIVAQMRTTTTGLMAMSNTGGQTWTSETEGTPQNSQTVRIFWCVYNGTWSANPSVAFSAASGTVAATAVMHVFREDVAGRTWSKDFGPLDAAEAAPSSPFTVSSTTNSPPGGAQGFMIAGWAIADDNTFGTLTGTGWSFAGTNQYRNQAGSDQSLSCVWKTVTDGTDYGTVTANMNASDAGLEFKIGFLSLSPPDQKSATQIVNVGQAVNRASTY